MNFSDFKFHPELYEGIEAMGFESPTPIQEQAIPAILEGRDIIGSAQTGTGKTAAFLLPVIQNIISSRKENQTRALVIVPTRELAIQIDQQMEGFSYFTSVSSIAVYGGGDGQLFAREKKALTEGTEVVICTPGRMIAHLNSSYVNFDGLNYLILDEADRMLDMGFFDDIMKIIQHLPKERQNLLFAATMPDKIRTLAKKVLRKPVEISIAISKPVEKVLQVAYVVYETQKLPLVTHLLKDRDMKSVIVFCSTKLSAKQLGRQLKKVGLLVQDIHSDLDQKSREDILLQFRNRKLNILVATDLLSRGIDIDNIELIINYDVPQEGEDYIHRIGRTARAESEGVAITLISEQEQGKFSRIETLLEKPVMKAMVPDEFGEAPEYNPGKYRGRGYGGQYKRKNYKGKKRQGYRK
ncbi:MAG: DEAD/DEAH box helicase [Bacteroidales bacterium]|nr:DEAD/DEAH box helicase [Bacteroidales bacterium]